MKRARSVPLMLVAGTATLYAFWVADVLLREFSTSFTWIDAGSLFVMVLVAGVAIGQLVGVRRGG